MISFTESSRTGKIILQTLFFFLIGTQICLAQWQTDTLTGQIIPPHRIQLIPHTPSISKYSIHPSFYDKKAEWHSIIDAAWGPGDPLNGKIAAFDTYKNFVRMRNATFQWNPINWDSLTASLRSKISDTTSRGEFARILNDLYLGLKDGHAYAFDNIVIATPLNPGVPIMPDGGGFINHFGAGLTPLEDSSLLVYKVVPDHPLGLVPGDIILGYQGIPWSQIVRELLAGGVPTTLWIGASQSSYNRILLWAAGESWHMFDTIDVVKYATGQTVHLPLDTMVTLNAPANMINNQQLPVPGVPMPTFNWNSGAVTYGIIDGTNIGYIYVYHHNYAGVSAEFDAAVKALSETDGLIIDIRLNWGGGYGLNNGISRLMNHSTFTLDIKERCSPTNLYEICPHTAAWWKGEIPSDVGTFYDRPIAVLLGPNCLSYGDVTSWQLSYIPNARMFGRSPQAIYSGMDISQPSWPGYTFQCPNVTLVDHYNPQLPRWGTEYPLYQEVWLTPEGVANGEDDVVNRAVEWMNNLVYPHNILTDKGYYNSASDSVRITSTVENPNSGQVSATAYLKTVAGVPIDSVNLTRSSFSLNNEQWVGKFDLPAAEDFYSISVTAFDHTNSEQFSMPDAVRFTTLGPVTLDSIYIYESTNNFSIRPFIKNQSSATITKAAVRLICNDAWVMSCIPQVAELPDIPPDSVIGPQYMFFITVNDSLFPDYFNFKVEVASDGWVYWIDSMRVYLNPTGLDGNEPAALIYSLEQNYPNPFNPSSRIKFSVADEGMVNLSIFNLLGECVAELKNELLKPGTYEVEFNASTLASGIYFYRLKAMPVSRQAVDFVRTKKMILMK